jgi:uncharacterized OB-fold protein
MRTIVNYFKQVFCKHNWIISESKSITHFYGSGDAKIVYMRCDKCGYHKHHNKYL